MLLLSRTIHFNAGRHLWRSDWTAEKNRAVYGDEGPHGYGHNYSLEVAVSGEPDRRTGMVVNLTDLDRVLQDEVDGPLDHRNLNLDVPEFAEVSPTAERLAVWIWDRVSKRIRSEEWPCRLALLRLRLEPGFSVEIEGADDEVA